MQEIVTNRSYIKLIGLKNGVGGKYLHNLMSQAIYCRILHVIITNKSSIKRYYENTVQSKTVLKEKQDHKVEESNCDTKIN